jgi:catechol 2,3-dioxygenase-like lactoylglutathione lyase family enzyme
MACRTLDHASIRVTDVERSRRFYEGVLGLTPAERPNFGFPGMWYQLGEGQLHLIQGEPVVAGDAPIDPTAPHFAIQVDDLDAMRRQLRAAGLNTLDLGSEQLWVLDPDGNTVELRTPPR